MSQHPTLAIESLSVAYGTRVVLHDLSFVVEQGKIVALLGGNGSGKSTLLKTVAGLLRGVNGKIFVSGCRIDGLSPNARHGLGVSYLLQGGRVFSNLTVEANHSIAVRASIVNHDLCHATLGEIFPELKSLATVRAGLLSGGQRQMLAIEMVLAQDASLLLLDEPLGGLAASAGDRALTMLTELAHSRGTAVLLAEQSVEGARAVSDSQIYLEFGTLVKAGDGDPMQMNSGELNEH